ncbi:MAG: hydrogenase iron-sulfur subunit [Actinobacteria bacterium]|nr:hydrogenase iron-sulfur subunit [Actinomycetota bacterium]
MTSPNGNGLERPLVLLCECAGTLKNIDFERLEQHAGLHADVMRGDHWCSRVGQAQMLELLEAGDGRQLVFAGCSPDFAARRFQKLVARGLHLEIADIREGCSWVHGEDAVAVTDKAARIIDSSIAYPDAPADTVSCAERHDTVVVIGGGVAGTQAAAELAQMGHHVELVERRPFLGGRAARIGTVFPTNDCGQCLPTTDAQAGTRKCFHRNVAIDHPDLTIRRRSTVEAVTGHPGDFQVSIRTLPNMVTDACINCGTCETVCEVDSSEPGKKAIFTEFYDGRVIRTIDLETCTFCGRCAEECPVEAIDFSQSPQRTTVHAGAILTATGCEPAPDELFSDLGYGRDGVVTQVELAEMLDDWAAQASLGRMPVKELVMVQCAGSRDKRHLPYCSRLCCMIALKHALRLKTLFPEMKVTICYLEMRTAGVGYENWFLAARQAGVEFLRGTPPEVQVDAGGRPVIEVEDVTAARKRVLRPDLVVLSTGMVPADETELIARTLGIERDTDGFIEILDRKNRATETSGEGIFVCGSAAGPKALIECNTEASAVASEIHNFLTSAGRCGTPASQVDATQCVGCDTCVTMCPFGAITLVDRPEGAPRPAEVKDDGKLAVIDPDTCRACGICAANCPEVAIAHNLSDDALFGRIAMMTHGVEKPIVGFYCKECAGAAIGLSGQHRDHYPESVRLIELPCLGRVSALHIVEAARLGAAGAFLAGCAEGRCQYRSGATSALEQMQIAGEVLAESGTPLPLELWNLCAVDRLSVGRRIRMFHAKAVGDELSAALLEQEMELIGAGAGALAGAPTGTAGGGGEVCGCGR